MRTFTIGLFAVIALVTFSNAALAQLQSASTHPKFVRDLPVPSRIDATAPGTTLNASMQETWQDLGLVDANGNTLMTRVWGYNFGNGAAYPSQTVEAKSGVPLQIMWTNELWNGHFLPIDTTVHWAFTHMPGIWNPATQTPVPAVAHLHGGHSESASDGLPEAWFTPGHEHRGHKFTKTTDGTPEGTPLPNYYDNDQQAATLWFHDHALGITRLNVYAGLAGFYLLRDEYEEQLIAENKIPSGAYEIEMAIQDRMFTNDGQLFVPSEPMYDNGDGDDEEQPNPTIMPEFFGDYILVNGMAWPKLNVEPRPYRFRILNGSDSRFYRLNLGGNQTFVQIGADGGFIEAPVALGQLTIGPGERADVVIDFSNYAGQTIIMKNSGKIPFPNGSVVNPNTVGQIMAFVVDQPLNNVIPKPVLPTTLLVQPELPTVTNTRQLLLFEGEDSYGRLLPSLGTIQNGMMRWDDPISESPLLGATEMWEVYNTTPDAHPIHLHLVTFRIIDRQRFIATQDETTGALTNVKLIGKAKAAPATERGWKDTAPMMPGEVTRVVATFDRAGEYVWHCHILSHEDHEMMRPFVVVDAIRADENTNAQPLATNVLLEQNYPNPANDNTQIAFTLDSDLRVKLTVYDLQGKPVVTIIEQQLPSGKHTVNLATVELPAGVYFYALEAGDERIVKRMEVIR